MKNFVISLFIFLICAFVGMWWFYTCTFCKTNYQEKNQTIENKITVREKPPQKSISKINENFTNIKNETGKTLYSFEDQLKIFKNSDSIHIPQSLFKVKDSLFSYLNKNQNKELLIIGWHKSNEIENNSNFGIERANYLKKTLTKFGLNPDKISVSSTKEEYSYNESYYSGGVELVLQDISEEKVRKINKGIVAKNLYTKFNSRKFIPDNTLLTYTSDLKNYLINNPEKSVKITGHTDNVGEESDNKIIGFDRATNVMNHFIANGIDKNKLKAFSEGENTPIAKNFSKEGRAKNRRIEIIVN